MEQVEQLNPFYFKFEGKVARLFGRESVSNSIVALCEIIKNSWDADATEVKIIFENPESERGKIHITDNGSALTLQEFENTWMVVATDDKEKHPVTKKFKRPKVGEKGIGRFATEKLAHFLKIISRPEGEKYGFNVEINWDEYEKGGYFDKIPNPVLKFMKKKKEHGFEIILTNLRERWDTTKMDSLQRTLGLLLPPLRYPSHPFKVRIFIGDSSYRVRKLKSKFPSLSVYKFKSNLNIDGSMNFRFLTRTGKSYKSNAKIENSRCGPAEFDLYFFYRDKRGNYPENVGIKNIRNTLDRFGGLHLYRDGFKVSLAGDWAGLDKLRVNDPSNYPGHNQIIGFVKISKKNNPDIVDTTTREGIVENEPWEDLKIFIYESIDVFVENRKRIEGRTISKKKRKSTKKPEKIETEELLAFSNSYPWVFYSPLENEINACYSAKLFNACLLLSRKIIENLIYNLLRVKFSKNIQLRWNTNKNRPHDFAVLVDNLVQTKHLFDQEGQTFIDKFANLCKPFRRCANSKAHNIMEYVERKEEIDNLKIPEMIQILLNIIGRT